MKIKITKGMVKRIEDKLLFGDTVEDIEFSTGVKMEVIEQIKNRLIRERRIDATTDEWMRAWR